MHADCISLFFSPKTTFERSFIPRAGPSHISNPGGAWQGGKPPVTPLSEKMMIQGPGRFQSGGDELKVDSLFRCYMFISVRTCIYIYTYFFNISSYYHLVQSMVGRFLVVFRLRIPYGKDD